VLRISQHLQRVAQNQRVKVLVKDGRVRRLSIEQITKAHHGLITDFHELWLNMLHRKENREDQCVELGRFKLEAASGAVFNHILDQLEESLSKVWMRSSIRFNDLERRLTQREHNLLEERLQTIAHPFEQS
jgi:hypothetical protein